MSRWKWWLRSPWGCRLFGHLWERVETRQSTAADGKQFLHEVDTCSACGMGRTIVYDVEGDA